MGGRDTISSAVPADIAERISDSFANQARLNAEAEERGIEAADTVRRQAAEDNPEWLTSLVDDEPRDLLRKLYGARNYPRVQAVLWAQAIDLAASYAHDMATLED